MKGFNNIGNTCYLNSGLQMLIQNIDLCKMIIYYSEYSPKLNIIADFIKEYYNQNKNAITPINIKKIVEQNQELFIGSQQQDSTEFIVCLLNIIEDEITEINKRNNKNDNNINILFGIKFNVRIKCKLRNCLQIFNHTENNNFLLLDINSETNSLEDAYHKLKSGEKLELDNQYYCENCKDKRIASKRTTIIEWPKYLIVWLKRFHQTGRNVRKNSQTLDIPLIWRHNNVLKGAVIHYGNLNGGHYVYVGEKDNKWYLYDDASVAEIEINSIQKYLSNAYCLLYVRNSIA
jgi:ubiquitin C-terminal hydrolase